MRKLFFCSAIALALVPMRANADPCPQGYEPVKIVGPWTVCEPITDPQRCEPIASQPACDNRMGFTIASHEDACQRGIDVLNERCAANKAAWKAHEWLKAVCSSSALANDWVCTAAIGEVLRAQQHAREVRKATERRLRRPVSGGGLGFRLKM